jgi:hypothetical protein
MWVIVLWFAIAVCASVFTRDAPSLRVRSGGVSWNVHGSIEQRIPWTIVSYVQMSKSQKDVLLGLSIDREIRIPRKAYRHSYTPAELYKVLIRGMPSPNPGGLRRAVK